MAKVTKKTASRGHGRPAKRDNGRSAPAAPAAMEIAFDYIKSNLFRVVLVTGVFGGIDAQGRRIHMAIFNERRPIPRSTVQIVNLGTGQLGPEIKEKRVGRTALVREVEADLVMDAPTAKSLRQWLDEKIVELERVQEAEAQTEKSGGS